VRFDYVKSGAVAAETRTLEPWGVRSWRCRWYVAGLDRDRGEPRSFRLSRISGDVEFVGAPAAFDRPANVDLLAMVSGRTADDTRIAHVRVSGPGVASLRRIAGSDADGMLEISYSDVRRLARQVASAGSAAHVVDPPELVNAVIARLSAAAGLRA